MKLKNFICLLSALFFLSGIHSLAAEECDLNKYEQLGGNFSLMGHDGKTYALNDFKGKIVWIYFGYTFCPDVCPMTLSNLKKVYDDLDKQAENIQVLFITVDPERDTSTVLKEYMSFFNPAFIGLRGTDEEIRTVAAKYGVSYYSNVVESEGQKYKLFAHTNRVFMLDRQGILRSLGSASHSYENMYADTKKLLETCS